MEKIKEKIQRYLDSKNRKKLLFKRYKKRFLRSYQELANFEEPIMQLIRRNHRVEFYENVIEGEYVFTHSDGGKRTIELDPSSMLTFDYGKTTFKGYVCDEDSGVPLPERPIITSGTIQNLMDKVMKDKKLGDAKKTQAMGGLIWQIGKIILYFGGGIVALLIIDGLMDFGILDKILNRGTVEVVKTVVQNASSISVFP